MTRVVSEAPGGVADAGTASQLEALRAELAQELSTVMTMPQVLRAVELGVPRLLPHDRLSYAVRTASRSRCWA
ncbi:MAG: hypothetical protein ACKVWR_12585 [Acidimicrobiales bacterium]